MTRSLRIRLVTIGVLTVLLFGTAVSAQASPGLGRCEPITTTVAMTPGGPVDQRVAGTLCTPRHRKAKTVQLLVSGGFYGQSYWMLPPDPRLPSYVDTMVGAGYATLAIDRLGTGRSSHPPSGRFQDRTHTEVVHQVLQQLRQGRFGQRFARTVLVGHSLSSAVATQVAIEHPADLDGVILTGVATKQNARAFEEIGAAIWPANQDPRFAGRGLDDGYLTTRPGARAGFFFHRPTISPPAIAVDEALKETDVLPSPTAYPEPSAYRAIQDPVLVAVGQYDRLICGAEASDCSNSAALLAQEAPWYGPAAKVEAAVIANTGHSINQQRTAPVFFDTAREWVDRQVGR